MLRWIFKLIFLGLLGFGFFHIAFQKAPDLNLSAPSSDVLAANMPGRPGQPEIRVILAEALDSASLTINGKIRMEVVTMKMATLSQDFDQSDTVEVKPTGQGIKIGNQSFVRAKLKSLDKQPIRMSWGDGQSKTTVSFPYEFEIYGTHVSDGKQKLPKVRVLARLPIEEYLYGVLIGEMPSTWPLEALRAQAVAARTYAYFAIRSSKNEEYDVKRDTRSQMWRPTIAPPSQVKRAVDSTAGIVLTENNALIKTFFSSECGGFTADARWVFTRTPVLALSGVRCPRCADPRNKPTAWTVRYTPQEIALRLRKAGLLRQKGDIRAIQALDRDGKSMGKHLGRVVTVDIVLAGGSGLSVRIPANDFRSAIGNGRTEISSTYMTIDYNEAQVTFSGLGWGHGVGMCQHGASYAAEKLGFNYLDILALYYPGAKPVRLWGM